MLSIKNCNYELVINKSKFLNYGIKVDSLDEVKIILKEMKVKYSDSTHICYAYIIDNLEKCSDDGEPSGTAGLPILNVLKNNNLNHILIIIIRYFGGIKLGSGGLIRAYSNCTTGLINNNIIELNEYNIYKIEFNYSNEKNILHILGKDKICNKEYKENITYEVIIDKKKLESIKNIINNYEKKGKIFI